MRLVSMALTVGVVLAFAGCDGDKPTPLARLQALPAARVPLAEFRHLRWIEGRWRGSEVGGTPFYEAYGFVDDSTIRSYVYTDSTLTTLSDSGTIRWSGDSIVSGSDTPAYLAVRFDSVSVEFAPLGHSTNGFTWTHAGPGAWRARLTWDSAGRARERTYDMRSIP